MKSSPSAGAFALLVLILAFQSAGCYEGREKPAVDIPDPSVDTSLGWETYSVVGQVMEISPDHDVITVHHGPIEGLMGAMTMPFAVKDTAVISGLAVGDSIRFEIAVTGPYAVVTTVERQ